MINIVDIYRFGGGCPTEWFGKDDKNTWYYFRYRFGWLTAEISSTNGQVFKRRVGGKFEGIMNFADLKTHLNEYFAFTCEERPPTNEELDAIYV